MLEQADELEDIQTLVLLDEELNSQIAIWGTVNDADH